MKFTKEIKIALVAIAGLVTLFFGLNFLKGLNIFSSEEIYYLSFKDITGLSASSPIYADGYRVGVVKSIDYDFSNRDGIRVEAGINPELRIPKGSRAEIVSDLLGNIQVNLLLANNPRERMHSGDVIYGIINDGAMGKVKEMIPAIEKILPKLDSIMYSLNLLLADPSIARSIHHVETITENLAVTSKELNTMMVGLNRNVPGMFHKANEVLNNVNTVTSTLAKVDVATTMARVDATLQNVEQLSMKLNSNEGTLGLLMRDPSLYNNLNSTMRNADSLLVNLRSNPKRYVHFSLFGRKDK